MNAKQQVSQAAKKRTKHPGVKLKKRMRNGKVMWLARWVGPWTRKEKEVSLLPRGLTTKKRREAFAVSISRRVLAQRKIAKQDETLKSAEKRPGHKGRRRKLAERMRFKVFEADGFKCTYCGRGPKDGVILHVDHKVPVIKGGTDVVSNLTTSCQQCNSQKAARLLGSSQRT